MGVGIVLLVDRQAPQQLHKPASSAFGKQEMKTLSSLYHSQKKERN